MQQDAYICLQVLYASIYVVYMAAYSHIYLYMHHFSAQEVCEDQFIVHLQPGSWCVLHR